MRLLPFYGSIGFVIIAFIALSCGGGGSGDGGKVLKVDAGDDQTVDELTLIALSGSAEASNVTIDSVVWTQTTGPLVILADSDAFLTSFMAPEVTEDVVLSFQLAVTATDNTVATDTVRITIRNLSARTLGVSAGADQTVDELTAVDLNGVAAISDIATMAWTQTAGPPVILSDSDMLDASFIAPEVNADVVLTFHLAVTATDDTMESDSVRITVRDKPLRTLGVDAGLDQTVDERDTVDLNGTVGITDIAAIAWTQMAGPSVTLSGSDTLSASFLAPNVTTGVVLTFRLEVTANDHTIENDTVRIVVQNINQVVFSADLDIQEKEELYLVDIDGQVAQRKLNHALDPETAVLFWQPSPDGLHVAYISQDQVNFDDGDLYVSPIVTGMPVKVSGDLPVGGKVDNFAWSPDGSRIVYLADQNRVEEKELFSVASDGASRHRISLDMNGDSVADFQWAPNGRYVAYTVSRNFNTTELYVTEALPGSQSRRVSGPLTAGGEINWFEWSPDSQRIAYTADQNVDETIELFTTTPEGAPILNVSRSGSNAYYVIGFTWAPDGSRIAFTALRDIFGSAELFSTDPAAENAVQQLFGSLAPTWDLEIFSYQWAPDRSRVAYVADQDSDDTYELYTVRPDGSGNLKVSGSLPENGDVGSFSWSPDSRSLAYIADQRNDGLDELFLTSPATSTSFRLSPDLVAGGVVESFKWSPDGARLAYVADQRTDNTYELFTVRPDGSEAVIVSGNMRQGGEIPARESAYEWSDDGGYVVYTADQDLPSVYELFSSTPESSRRNVKLHDDLTGGRTVFRFEIN